MLRLVGCAMMFLSCVAAGFLLSNRLSRRVKELEGYLRFVEELTEELHYTMAAPKEMIQSVFQRIQEDCVPIVQTYLSFPKTNENFPLEWEKASMESETALQTEDRTLVASMAYILGGASLESQITSLSGLRRHLETRLKEATAFKDKHAKLYQALGTLGGIALVVFMI